MLGTPTRLPRQPKLRSSCDGCGAAKVKCDRGLPECGRCLSLDLRCIYGVSRKMGKPPRERLRYSEVPNTSRTLGEHAESIDKHKSDDHNYNTGTIGSALDGTVRTSGQSSNDSNGLTAWIAGGDYLNSLMSSHNALDTLDSDQIGPAPLDFTSLDFGEWTHPDNSDGDVLSPKINIGLTSSFETNKFEGHSAAITQSSTSSMEVDEGLYFDNALLPSVGSRGHDCSQEAYEILGNLSLPSSIGAHSTTPPTPSSGLTTANTAYRIPLDHILSLNRESSERLSRVITCSCARSPQLALLHGSIISQILNWYQQALDCTFSALENLTGQRSTTDLILPNVYSPWSPYGSSSPWSSTAASTIETGGASTPILIQGTSLAVAPTRMAIGSYNIDDQRVQAALRVQLLLGEMRRTGSLIAQLTLLNSGEINGSTPSHLDSLYKSLGSWLRGEHSRIADTMRSRLKEIST